MRGLTTFASPHSNHTDFKYGSPVKSDGMGTCVAFIPRRPEVMSWRSKAT